MGVNLSRRVWGGSRYPAPYNYGPGSGIPRRGKGVWDDMGVGAACLAACGVWPDLEKKCRGGEIPLGKPSAAPG